MGPLSQALVPLWARRDGALPQAVLCFTGLVPLRIHLVKLCPRSADRSHKRVHQDQLEWYASTISMNHHPCVCYRCLSESTSSRSFHAQWLRRSRDGSWHSSWARHLQMRPASRHTAWTCSRRCNWPGNKSWGCVPHTPRTTSLAWVEGPCKLRPWQPTFPAGCLQQWTLRSYTATLSPIPLLQASRTACKRLRLRCGFSSSHHPVTAVKCVRQQQGIQNMPKCPCIPWLVGSRTSSREHSTRCSN